MRLPVALTLALAGCLLCGQGASAQQAKLPDDPAAPGPFQVGVTTRAVTRMLDDGQPRTVASLIWYPANVSSGATADPALFAATDAPSDASAPHPLIVFSHGYGSNPQGISYFLSHLASYGFVVVGPMHNDCVAICPYNTSQLGDLRRPGDIKSVLDNALALSAGDDPILKSTIDPNSIGMAGWSLGGYTSLKAMEADPRFLSGFVLAPAVAAPPPPDPAKVSKPMMFLVGELDTQVTYPMLTDFFSKIPTTAADHWFLDVPNHGHANGNTCSEVLATLRCAQLLPQSRIRDVVDRWGTAFMMRYVARNDRYASWLDSPSPDSCCSVTHVAPGAAAPPLPAPQTIMATAPSLAPPPPGTVLFKDDMSDATTGRLWAVNANANRSAAYENGEYALRTISGGQSRLVNLPGEVEASLPGQYNDVSVEADVRLMDSEPDRHVDIACRSKDPGNDYRLAVVPGSGLFQLSRWWQYQVITLTNWRTSTAIRGGGEINHLQISCQGTQIATAINGVAVASVQDNTYSGGQPAIATGQVVWGNPLGGTFFGQVGPKGRAIEARFSNLVVKQL